MARFYPPEFPSDSPRSERVVWDSLSDLDEEWLVFHSVPWQAVRHGKQGDGEADFVLAHPNRGVLVVEVKGGEIELNDGRWTSVSRDGSRHKIRDPFEQAVDSKYSLRSFLEERVPRLEGPPRIGHAVAFPDVEVDIDLAPNAPREIIADWADLRRGAGWVNGVARHWDRPTRFDDQQFSALRKSIAPTRSVRRLPRQRVAEAVDQLVELTEQQVRGMSFLRRQRRTLVAGGAGTGKTMLAAERARQLASDGLRVLFVCFNAPLGQLLASQAPAGVVAGHIHGIARDVVGRANDLPKTRGAKFFDELVERLPYAVAELDEHFDAVVVDEGQDFAPSWFASLELCLRDPASGFFAVFADSRQALYRDDWEAPFDGEPFVLEINCRNTAEIAECVSAVFDEHAETLGVSGPWPRIARVPAGDIALAVSREILGPLEGGLGPEQIVVLTQTKRAAIALRGREIGGHPTVELGRQGIAVETIHRFKGLEADMVVVVLENVDVAADLALAYVGMSRARAMLSVVCEGVGPSDINWPF